MHTRHAILLVCVLACGHTAGHSLPAPALAAAPPVLAGPTVAAESLRVATTDTLSVNLTSQLANGLKVTIVSDRGALDFIDGGGDVLVTDRLSVIRYASSRADFATFAMPWDREYVFAAGYLIDVGDLVDAVHVDARPSPRHCPPDGRPRSGEPGRPIGYPANDSIAHSLAERVVGLGLATRAKAMNLRFVLDSINQVGSFIVRHGITDPICENESPFAITPLVDTRSHLIVRRGAVGVVTDTTGNLRLATGAPAP